MDARRSRTAHRHPMLLALKVDVDTLRGAREGIPRLVEILQRHDAGATFLWSLGPDAAAGAIRRAFGGGFRPDVGRRARDTMIAARDAGFENGILGWDPARWQAGIADGDERWTTQEMQRAIDRFGEIMGERPSVRGAPGWQMNRHALRLTQRLGFAYCSDGRGFHPHLPVWNAELVRCPQFPTTLPTLDELLGCEGVDLDNLASTLLAITTEPADSHVFTLHAEREGRSLSDVFERLVIGWKAQGWSLVALRALYESVEPLALPRCEVGPGTVPGRSGTLLVQGNEFLGGVEMATAPLPDTEPLPEVIDAREESG